MRHLDLRARKDLKLMFAILSALVAAPKIGPSIFISKTVMALIIQLLTNKQCQLSELQDRLQQLVVLLETLQRDLLQ